MTRTTPPRPLDVVAGLPELAGLARTATRLHPRRGTPTVHDSSVGGPLLWPAGEPWPEFEPEYGAYGLTTTLADIRKARGIGEEGLTGREWEAFNRSRVWTPAELLPDGPLPLIPLVQLYARDVPGLPCPEGTDMLQVLWTTSDEFEQSGAVQLRWRQSSDVRDILAGPPEPAYVEMVDQVPTPCVLHPEQVREFPPVHLLTDEQAKRVEVWAEERSADYRRELSVAPGWKLGGWPSYFTYRHPAGPDELRCGECGGPVEALLTVDSSEWHGFSRSWSPVEDVDEHPYAISAPTMVSVGRGWTLQIYACVGTPSHLPRSIMQ
ncbi:hypothetical protein ABZ752_09420 [Streptomyces roseifaciens]